jgi:hypothetical protein
MTRGELSLTDLSPAPSRRVSEVCELKRKLKQLHHANTLDAGAQPHAPIGQGFQLL